MIFKKMLLALVMVFACTGMAMADGDFTRSAIQMGTSYCPNVSFECEHLTSKQSDIIEAANECVAKRFKFTENVMNDFRSSGEFENCVLSDRAFKSSGGANSYAVCCVKKGSGEDCEMNCTRYIDQK